MAAVVTASRMVVTAVATDVDRESLGSASDAVGSVDTGARTVDRLWGRTVVPMPRLRRAAFVTVYCTLPRSRCFRNEKN